jgi:hypothetical protein
MFEHRLTQQAKASGTPSGAALADKWTVFHVRYAQLYLQLASLSEDDDTMEARFQDLREERKRLFWEFTLWDPDKIQVSHSTTVAPGLEGPAVITSWDEKEKT